MDYLTVLKLVEQMLDPSFTGPPTLNEQAQEQFKKATENMTAPVPVKEKSFFQKFYEQGDLRQFKNDLSPSKGFIPRAISFFVVTTIVNNILNSLGKNNYAKLIKMSGYCTVGANILNAIAVWDEAIIKLIERTKL